MVNGGKVGILKSKKKDCNYWGGSGSRYRWIFFCLQRPFCLQTFLTNSIDTKRVKPESLFPYRWQMSSGQFDKPFVCNRNPFLVVEDVPLLSLERSPANARSTFVH
jgi:hypothetical protein